MAKVYFLPNGKPVTVPDNATEDEILRANGFGGYAAPEEAPAPRASASSGIKSDLYDDVQRGLGGLMAGAGSAIRDIDEGAGQWLQNWGNEIVANNPADYGSVSDIKSIGDVVGFGLERLLEMTPQVGVSAAGALIRVPPPVTMGATTALTTYGEAREAQREAGEYNPLKAALAAAGAGLLDTVGVAKLIPGSAALREITEGGFKGIAKQAGKTALEEAPTEVAQQALQRFGGGQELLSPEAIEEYKFAGLAGGLVGGGLGGIAGGVAPRFNAPAVELPVETGAAQAGVVPIAPPPPAPRTATRIEIPAGLSEAAPISTIEIPDITAPEEGATTTLSILSQPDDAGNVWVRTPDGVVTPMRQTTLALMGADVAPTPAPVVTEPPVITSEAPEAVTAVSAAPITQTSIVAPPQPLPIEVPIDVTEPPAISVPEPVMLPEPTPVAAAPVVTQPEPTITPITTIEMPAPEAPATAVPTVAAPVTTPEPTPVASAAPPAPIEITAPPAVEPPVTPSLPEQPVAMPTPQPIGEPAPVEAPQAMPEPEPAPEQYVFTPEKAAEVGSHDPQLAQDLVGTNVPQAATLLAQRTKSPLYKQFATRVAGVAQAMVNAGIRMPVGVTAVKGGEGETTHYTMSRVGKPNIGGTTATYPLPGGGYRAIEVAMRGKPSPTAPRGANERTLLHELLHSVTTGIQRNPGKFPADSRVGQAVKQAKALHDTVLKGVENIDSGKLKVSDEVRSSLARLKHTNAFLNERELLAWGLTDYDMQNVLRAIPVKNGNAFTEFVRVIARMIGVGEKDMNALRELIEISEAIIPTDTAGISEVVDVVSGKAGQPTAEPQVEAEVDAEAVARWSEKRLSDYLRTYAYLDDGKRTKALAVSMKPDEFLNLTTMDGKHKAEIIEEAGDLDLKKLRDEPTAIVLFVSGDKDDLQVIGHEGRHRMAALKAAGIDEAPVVLKFESGKERAPMDGVTLSPEDFGSGRAGRTIEFAFNAIPISYDYNDQLRSMMTKYGGKVEVDYEQTAPSPIEDEAGRPVIQYSLGDETRSDRWRRLWVDKMRRLGFVEEAIQKSLGRPLSRAERTSEKAALFEGRADTRLNELNADHINKIIDALKKEGVRPQDLDLFLVAMAAPARNAKIAARNPSMPDGGSGMTNAVARQVILDVAARGDLPRFEKLADMVYAMTKSTRERMVEYGLLSRSQAEALEQAEPFYVPLKGGSVDGDMSTSGDEVFSAPGSGRGFSVTRKEYLAAKGRMSLPFSPLATAMNDAQDAIIRGERNRVGQSFLNDIARKYDSDAWQVFTDENPDKTLQYVQKTNKVREVPVDMAANSKNYFIVKEGGKPYYIKINDPILLRALTNGSTKDFSAINEFLGKTIGVATRALSQLHTTLNPEFFIPNVIRDVEAATFNILAEQDAVDGRIAGKAIVSGVLKDISNRQNWKRLFKATFNHEATTAEQQQMNAIFQQAKEDGAFTGWIMYTTPEEHMAVIKRELDQVSATGGKRVWYSTLNGAKKVMDVIQDFNSVFENNIRLAVYKNALEAGVTRDEAANMARNVTVDFNRKGEAGPTANAIYAFFNASIQGNVQLLRSLTAKTASGKSTRAQKMAIGMIGLGMLMAFAGRGMSDEDDDGMLFYDKIPDWEKERNMIIMLPDGREYIKIPMPYGYSFFHNGGANFVDLMEGKKTLGDFAVSTFSGLLNNFSPVPISGQSLSGIGASVVPTALRPFADLAINENFFGSPIYNEPFDENQAQSSVSRYSTPQGYKSVVEFLNELTGGKGKVAGAVDLPAESIEYLMQYYVGSAGKFIGKLWGLGEGMTGDKEIPMKDIPLFNKVLGEPNKQNDLGLYYDRLNEINPIQRQLKDSYGEDRQFMLEKFPVETNPRVVSALKAAQKQIKDANQAKRALMDRDLDSAEKQDRLNQIDECIHKAYLRFNQTYNEAKKREE